ncbi:methyl-accepting chemotaxis protein [Pseudomonas stutzeri]|uniref:methyl-accepting chemotaxis protein n=1 Tax=Stutzerimonas stutzeri TaxID=316 RepID=UPI002109377B|nr:methyl-accepting chemotaxis protein [Stutzerimonas stutzeri]MCQ4285884.1 methyl-accepting chemotaxis protein [Stutzerimonas stutzeri]
MQFWRRSIQSQLVLSMGAALLASVLIVLAIYSNALNRLTDRHLIEQALPASIEAIRNDLERTLTAPLTAVSGIANNVMVERWLADGEDASRVGDFVPYLKGVQTSQNALTTSIAVLASGNYYAETGLARHLERGNPRDGWFYSFIDSGVERRAEVDIDKASRLPTLFVNQRISANGKTLGVAGLGYSLASLSDMVKGFQFGERGHVYLVGRDARIKVHPQAEHNDAIDLSTLTSPEAAIALVANSGKAVRFERSGETFIALAQPIESLGWTLVSEVPEAEIYSETQRTLWMTSAIGLAIALLSLGLVVLLARGLAKPIRQVTAALVEIGGGGGDLTRRLDDSRADELGDLARGFNRFLAGQRTLIGDVLATSEQLRSAVVQVARVVGDTAKRSGRQQEMTDMVATAVNEMGLTVQEIAQNANQAADASQLAHSEATVARQEVGHSVTHIEHMSDEIGSAAGTVAELAAQVASIDQVLSVIRGISERTNLLALNAAIEAARAGEMGRGFAVVADEVRTLASRTQASTDEIQQMTVSLQKVAEAAVNSMQSGQKATGIGVEASQRTSRSLAAITDQIERISDMNTQVATATEEQSSVTEEINRNVHGIAELAHSTAADVQSCLQDCKELTRLADDLNRQMGSFKL